MNTWISLKKIGQSKIVTMTIIIPLFGYMIFFNESMIKLFELSTSYLNQYSSTTNMDFEYSNKLFYLYFGFSFIGIASLIYRIVSPDLINEYKSLREYIDKEKNIMSLTNVTQLYNLLKDNSNNKVDKLQDNIIPVETVSSETVTNIMSINWEHHNTSFVKTRNIIFYLYIFGFVLVFIPSIQMFYSICIIFFSN